DRLAKLELPLFQGRFRLLGYDADNEITTAQVPTESLGVGVENGPRNSFEWAGRSFGGTWNREFGAARLDVTAWDARQAVDAGWAGRDSAAERLSSTRHDAGL